MSLRLCMIDTTAAFQDGSLRLNTLHQKRRDHGEFRGLPRTQPPNL